MTWIAYALCTAAALAVADICIKLASGKLSNSLGLLLYGSCTFLAGVIWVLLDKRHKVDLYAQPEGILAAVGVGVAFSAVTIGLYVSFGAGAPISLVSPIVRLGGLLVASIAGILFLHEPLTIRYVIGTVLAFGGVALIITR
ncbi:MAG: EamA family transporter [Desulfobacteraceae bacterium]|jgi:bacterial/archaeal transporter family protein